MRLSVSGGLMPTRDTVRVNNWTFISSSEEKGKRRRRRLQNIEEGERSGIFFSFCFFCHGIGGPLTTGTIHLAVPPSSSSLCKLGGLFCMSAISRKKEKRKLENWIIKRMGRGRGWRATRVSAEFMATFWARAEGEENLFGAQSIFQTFFFSFRPPAVRREGEGGRAPIFLPLCLPSWREEKSIINNHPIPEPRELV